MDRKTWPAAAAIALMAAASAQAETPRELLVQAAFEDRSKAAALDHVREARQAAVAAAQRAPDDPEPVVVGATALVYHAKLTGSRSEAIAARRAFEAAATRFPRNPEAHIALAAWHLGLVSKYGRLVARAAVGAQKAVGLAAADRSIAIGGDRAMFAGLAALLRLQLDPDDPRGRALAEQASRAPTPTTIDRHMRRAATALLASLRSGDAKTTRLLAERLLPLGWYRD